MKNKIFEGVGTALITPFKDGKIDFKSLEALIESQISAGVNAIIIAGTTGECATLADSERYTLFEESKRMVGGRTRLIFGTGTNDTAAMLRHSRVAERISPDGLLVVTPYYNKGTEDGILNHYESLINTVNLPIIVYNVSSRTGVNISISTLEKLARYDNVVGIKEAGDSMARCISLATFGDELPLYAGNDNQIFTTLSLGGAGVISVVSNLLPKECVEIYSLAKSGKWEKARQGQFKMLGLIDALFCETNPAPVKWLMHSLGRVSDEIRLPLTMPREESRLLIADRYKEYLNQ